MRLSGSAAIFALATLCAAGLYIAYDVTSASPELPATMPPRIETLGELLDVKNNVAIKPMGPADTDAYVGQVIPSEPWRDAEMALTKKGLLLDMATFEAFVAQVDDTTVSVVSAETHAVNGTYGVIIYARDAQGNVAAWYMITNIGQKSVVGADPTISTIPVYVWSNGMPVYFVSIWHWMGPGWWVPYHYWWHDSHNHPNWYYSYYNYWWWYHYWYDYPVYIHYKWFPWYNWYYAWFYWRYFYYWSTYFKY